MEDESVEPDWTGDYMAVWHEGRWLIPFGDWRPSAAHALSELAPETDKELSCFMFRGSWFIGLKETNDARS